MLRRWLRALALALVYLLLACGGPTEPDPTCGGEMCPVFYRGFGTAQQIDSRISIANWDGKTAWHYRIEADRGIGVLVDRTVTVQTVEHTIRCSDLGSPNGLTTITWAAEINRRADSVSANLNC